MDLCYGKTKKVFSAILQPVIFLALNLVEELPIEIPVANHSVQSAYFNNIVQAIDVKE